MLVIFTASTDLGSAAHSAHLLIPFLYWMNPHMSPAGIELAQFIVRKGAHLTEYAVLAMLLLRALHSETRGRFARQALIVIGVAAIYAATDELHQSVNPSRTASVRDVMIDCCGAVVGLLTYRLLTLRGMTRDLAPVSTQQMR
jgi:VanZ family protein